MYTSLLNKIKEYNTILIHGHVRPDGDCLGSQFGLKHLLKHNFPNKEIYVVGQTSDYVAFLGNVDEVEDSKYKGSLVIVVDTGNEERISDQRHSLADYVVKIDHHIADTHYGNEHIVKTHYPACAQIIAEFAYESNLEVNSDAAFALYTGIVTDTGRFKYSGVSEVTFNLAGKLITSGADIVEIDRALSSEKLETIKFKGYVLDNFETTKDGVAYIKVTRQIVEKYKISDEDAAAQVNLLAGIDGFPAWALVMEYPDNEIRLRLRSRGPVLNELAGKYGGGGHAMACGASISSWDELDTFINDYNEVVKKYKEELK